MKTSSHQSHPGFMVGLLLLTMATLSFGQRLSGIHGINQVRTFFYNYGSIGRPNSEPSFTWPKDTGNGYAYEFGLIIGAEVADTSGNTIHLFSEGLIDGGDRSPGGMVWGWQPAPEYVNPDADQPPMSNAPDSWLPEWSAWPGLSGEDVPTADLESYYVMDDRDNAEFAYFPFSEDSSLRGLGLQVTCRGFQWTDLPYENFIIYRYEIKNISDKPLNKLVVGLFGDPHIGGPGDFADDFVGYSLEDNLVYCYDKEDSGNDFSIPWSELGWFGIQLLETPKNSEHNEIGLTSVNAPVYASTDGTPANDPIMWEMYRPGNFSAITQETDNVLEIGSGYCSIPPDSTQLFTVAYVFGKGLDNLRFNAKNAQMAYSALKGETAPVVHVKAPAKDSEISGTCSIEWTAEYEGGEPLTIDLYYDNHKGSGLQPIANGLANSGSYSWDTEGLEDGLNYRIVVFAKTDSIRGVDQSDFFIVNNPNNSAEPEIELLYPLYQETLSGDVEIQWRAGDADGDAVTVHIYYSDDRGNNWRPLAGPLENTGSYIWNTRQLPNGHGYQIKLTASDGTNEVESNTSLSCSIDNEYALMADSLVTHVSGRGDGSVEVKIVDITEATGHVYRLTFDDSSSAHTTYDVYDVDNRKFVLENCTQLSPEQDGPLFDGLRLIIDNVDPTIVDTDNSGWISGQPNISLAYSLYPAGGVRYPADYEIRFFDSVADTALFTDLPVHFQIWNISENKQEDIYFRDNNGDKELSVGDVIVIIQYFDGTAKGTWQVEFNQPDSGEAVLPQDGAVLRIKTLKTFSGADVFEFQDPYSTGVDDGNIPPPPQDFFLEQNYPNPFNPETAIRYHVRSNGNSSVHVELNVYNMLGQKVATLVSKKQNPGQYRVTWQAANLPSGIYFYRLQAGRKQLTRKCLLLK